MADEGQAKQFPAPYRRDELKETVSDRVVSDVEGEESKEAGAR